MISVNMRIPSIPIIAYGSVPQLIHISAQGYSDHLYRMFAI